MPMKPVDVLQTIKIQHSSSYENMLELMGDLDTVKQKLIETNFRSLELLLRFVHKSGESYGYASALLDFDKRPKQDFKICNVVE